VAFRDVRMRGFRSRAGVAEVVAWVDRWDAPLPAEDVPLGAAAGRVLSEGIVAAADVPPFLRAAMDGWAVDGASTFGAGDADPLSLRVVGDSRPGAPPPPPLSPGEAVRIRTGAPVPLGADAVLPAELGEEADGRLEVRGEVPPGRHVGRVGEDVRRGTEVLSALRRLRPQDVGLLSLVGVAAVRAVTVKPGGATVQVSPCDIQTCWRGGRPDSSVPPGAVAFPGPPAAAPGGGSSSSRVAPYSPAPVCATDPPSPDTISWKP